MVMAPALVTLNPEDTACAHPFICVTQNLLLVTVFICVTQNTMNDPQFPVVSWSAREQPFDS